MRTNVARKFISLYAYLLNENLPKQNVVLVFHVIHLSHNNFINPVITDMNQSVLADIRLSLGLPKMVARI